MEPNRQILLLARPRGMVRESDFSLKVSAVKYPANGMLLARTLFLSMDPYIRGRMREGPQAFALNEPLRGYGIGIVKESGVPLFKRGDLVTGMFSWADYSLLNADEAQLVSANGAPPSMSLGLLGLTGLTAYFGMIDIGQPQKNETALISAAAGAVGSVAGQIARIKGCRAVGMTGSDEKARIVREEFGFDDAINYKKGDLGEALARSCPNGVDIYFDNVGGAISDEVMNHVNQGARIVICGQISQYNLPEKSVGPRPFPTLLFKGALARGLLIHRYNDRFETARLDLSSWLHTEQIKTRETVVEGLENAPRAFVGLFTGENIGKCVVKVSSAESETAHQLWEKHDEFSTT